MAVDVRVLTWNLQGSKGVDVTAVGEIISAARPDVVVLQEVQRRQVRPLAVATGARSWRWAFKHWPVVTRAEGMAVMTRHRLAASSAYVVRRAVPWSWRRRIAIEAVTAVDGVDCAVVDVHLSPHDAAGGRSKEIDTILARPGTRGAIVAGDLNDEPDGPAHSTVVAAGWVDAWQDRHGEQGGATNWTTGRRAGRAPTQRLDYVFAPAGWVVVDCAVIAAPLDVLAELSDHLPVTATVRAAEAA